MRMKYTVREQSAVYDVGSPKRAANVTINADLLRRARDLDVNLSQTLEEALIEVVRQRTRERWLAENREAIEAYNQHVDSHGVFGDKLRGF